MLEPLVTAVHQITISIKSNYTFLLTIIAILWVIQLFNAASGYRLNALGIYPRRAHGLIGIFTAPFLHGSSGHLFFNSIPLFVLSALILVKGHALYYEVTFLIVIFSGILLWLFGRAAYHVGASCLIMGYWSYLLYNAYLERSAASVLLAIVCIYYFGSFIFSLFPQEERVSWEGHLFGFIAGLFVSYGLLHGYFNGIAHFFH